MNMYNDKPLVEGLLDEIEYVYLSDNRPWIIGYSGGKDSTLVVHLVYEMLKRLPKEKRCKDVHIVSSDILAVFNFGFHHAVISFLRICAVKYRILLFQS